MAIALVHALIVLFRRLLLLRCVIAGGALFINTSIDDMAFSAAVLCSITTSFLRQRSRSKFPHPARIRHASAPETLIQEGERKEKTEHT
jgi:hypothetical protein